MLHTNYLIFLKTGFVELPDGKVLSGSEWGNMLLWDGGLIKVEISKKGRKPCHVGMIEQFFMDEGELMTIGADGFVKVWDFESIDNADTTEEGQLFEMDPMYELKVGVKKFGRPEPFFQALVSLLLFISSVPYCKDCFAVHTYHFHNIHSRQCYSYCIKIKLSVTSDNGILSKLRDPSDTFQNFKSNSVSKLCSSSHVKIEDVSNQALYLL